MSRYCNVILTAGREMGIGIHKDADNGPGVVAWGEVLITTYLLMAEWLKSWRRRMRNV